MSKKTEIQDLDQILGTKDFMKTVLTRDAGLVRISNSLPQPDEMKYYLNNEQLKVKLRAINQKVLSQIRKIAQFSQYEELPSLVDLNAFSHIIGINDQLFENVDTTLDRMKKINAGTETSNLFGVAQSLPILTAGADPNEAASLIALATKEKPQNKFADQIDSDSNYPFIPKITHKHHSQLPLDETIIQAQREGAKQFFSDIQNILTYEFPHPYAYEIESLVFSEAQLTQEKVIVQEPASLKEDIIFVDSEAALDDMITALELAPEIAIDVEHHSQRSFQGITCLIQVSDRKRDYIIDVFSVWKSLYKFNTVTANPRIVKVLHGADMDVQWLQRDFAIYIVNLFDTGQAARALSMPNYSLSYLLTSIAKVQTDKKYQLADWRIRPIPKEMMSYARTDTHYLLAIYDNLRNQLVDRALRNGAPASSNIENVLNKSKLITLKKYIKPVLQDEKYHSILSSQRIILSDRKFRLLKKLLSWRFTAAATFDESPIFVLPNDILFQIVSRLPSTVKELTATQLKLSYVAVVKAEEIVGLIKSEIDSENQAGPVDAVAPVIQMQEEDNTIDIEQASYKEDNSRLLHSPIDDELVFTLETFDIGIELYQNKMDILESHYQTSSETSSPVQSEKMDRIKASFFYEDPVEFYCEKFPFLRNAYDLAKQQEQEIIKKRLDLTYIQNNPNADEENNTAGEADPTKDEYLAFQKEKGPSSKPKEQEQIDVPDLPLSYEDQFKTNIKKRKYNFGSNSNQEDEKGYEIGPGKKRPIGQKSTFDMLIEQEFRQSGSEDDEDNNTNPSQKQQKKKEKAQTRLQPEDKQKMLDDFNNLTDKIQNQMNKDPRYRSGIDPKQLKRSNPQNKGATGNKFISKFKKSGF